jgi:hypothetical protein
MGDCGLFRNPNSFVLLIKMKQQPFRPTLVNKLTFMSLASASRPGSTEQLRIEFAWRLAREIEEKVKVYDQELGQAVLDSFSSADPSGVTREILDDVVDLLQRFWKHGPEMKMWYMSPAGRSFRKDLPGSSDEEGQEEQVA